MNSPDFAGQIALVTGATRGIGRRIADDLERAGAHVIVTGTKARVEAAEPSGNRSFLAVDFLDERATTSFLEALDDYPRIDVCINNAGINRIAPIAQTRLDDWKAIQRVNLEAPMRILTRIAPRMAGKGYGRIVNIASILGVVGKAQRALYSMSKFGLGGLTKAIALELGAANVLANTVSPGFVRTELTDSILGPEEQAALRGQIPVGRFAEPEDISPLVVFLASSANTYVTGQNVVIDGGFTCA